MLLLALACTSPTTPPVGDVAVRDTATVWDRPDPGWTADELARVLADGLSGGVPSPHPIQKTYAALMALGDEVCPGDPEQLSNARQGLGGCTSESGVFYEGISSYGYGTEALSAILGQEYTEDSWSLSGDFAIIDADGQRFEAGGQARWVVQQFATETRWNAEVAGTFRYPASDEWLMDIHSNRVYVTGLVPDQGPPELKILGGISNQDVDVYLEQLVFGADGCVGPPASGVLNVRGDGGGWYRIELDEDCSGCGDVVFDDRVELGQTCLDLESFRARTESLRPQEGA